MGGFIEEHAGHPGTKGTCSRTSSASASQAAAVVELDTPLALPGWSQLQLAPTRSINGREKEHVKT